MDHMTIKKIIIMGLFGSLLNFPLAVCTHAEQGDVIDAAESLNATNAESAPEGGAVTLDEPVATPIVKGALAVTPEWTEAFLHRTHSPLLDDHVNDKVMSFYFFGRHGERTLIGLERVRGEDYHQYFTLLVFDNQTLLGFYRHIHSFPTKILSSGEVRFPRGYNTKLIFNVLSDTFPTLCQGKFMPCIPWMANGSVTSFEDLIKPPQEEAAISQVENTD